MCQPAAHSQPLLTDVANTASDELSVRPITSLSVENVLEPLPTSQSRFVNDASAASASAAGGVDDEVKLNGSAQGSPSSTQGSPSSTQRSPHSAQRSPSSAQSRVESLAENLDTRASETGVPAADLVDHGDASGGEDEEDTYASHTYDGYHTLSDSDDDDDKGSLHCIVNKYMLDMPMHGHGSNTLGMACPCTYTCYMACLEQLNVKPQC